MNPLLEVNPAACLFVMGPQLSHKSARNPTRSNKVGADSNSQHQAFSSLSSCFPPATYRSILEAGLRAATLLFSGKPDGGNGNVAQLVSKIEETASEDGLTVAMERLVGLVKRQDCYTEWLKIIFQGEEGKDDSFSINKALQCQKSTGLEEKHSLGSNATSQEFTSAGIESVQHLINLQKRGALLACTQYDTVLDSIAGTRPVTLQDIDTLKHWSSLSTLPETTQDVHKRQPLCRHPVGILHLHGVHTNPSSVHLTVKEEGESTSVKERRLARDDPDTVSSSSSPGMDILREIFRKRLVIFVGFDWDFFDPLLPGIMKNLYPNNKPGSLKNPPILLSSMPVSRQSTIGAQIPSLFLTLMVSKEELYDLSQVISLGSPKNFTVGKGLTDKQSSDGLKVQAFLLFNEKQSFRKLGDVIYQQSKSGEIYVRRDALTVIFDDNKILYGNLVTYGGNGLRQLWRLVFSEGSTLLGKGLMALGLQNAAIIWTNRKPAELGNVTGINSVHTYAAHKAVHTMAMAQQQHHSYLIHSSSGSSSGSVMPLSLTSSTSTANSVSLTNRATTSQSSQKQLSSETNPTVQMALKSTTRSSSEHETAGDGGKLVQRGDREIEEEYEDDHPSKESNSTHNSYWSKGHAPINNYDHPSEQFVAATTSSSYKTLTTTSSASIPSNFIHPPGTTATSPLVSKSSGVASNLSALQASNALNAAISNPLLSGLNLFALPGIGTPTGSLAGLVSPVLLTNNVNPFLAVLGSSPNLLASAPVTTSKSSSIGGVLNAATAATPVISYAPNQQASSLTSTQNWQLLSQLQERINTQLRSSTTLLTDTSTGMQTDMSNLLSLSRPAGVSALEAAAISATSVLDHELGKRERKLELLAMGKPPALCIAPPPELLWSRHGAVPVEHTIERIDTLQWKAKSSQGSGPTTEGSYSIGKRIRTDMSNSNHEELTRESRISGGSRLEESESILSNNSSTTSDCHLSIMKLESNKSRWTDTQSHLTSPSLPNNTIRTISSSPPQVASSNLASATISSPSPTQTSRLSSVQVTAAPSKVSNSSMVTSLNPVPSATPMAPALISPGFPLIYAVPPTTVAASATPGLRTTPLASSPLRGDFYVMLNPSAATSGVGTCGGTTVQSLMIAAAPALATSTTSNSTSVKNSPAAAAGMLPLQVPRLASGATGLIPSLGSTLSPVQAPMYYYIPNGGGSFQATASASTNVGLGTVTVGGTREDEEGDESHSHHGPAVSQSSLLRTARAKKRPQTDLRETEFLKSETKRMRMNTTDIPWANVKHQSESPLCMREAKVDCEEESEVADGAKAEQCATTSDTDDEVVVADRMFTRGGEDNKPFSYRGHLQLWEFLLDLLLTPNHGSIIQWTGNDYEFNIVNPEAIVRLWGAHKNKPHMTYEKMSRSLRYYYNQGIMDKVPGKRFTFRFAFDIQKYIIDNKKTALFTLTP